MKLIREKTENVKHLIPGNGAYEWWYFDAIDENDEFSFTMMFITGNPFSPDYTEKVLLHKKDPEYKKPSMLGYSAVSFNLYLKERSVYSVFLEFSEAEFIEFSDKKGIGIDKCSFVYHEESDKYFLIINIPESYTGTNFKAEFEFKVNADSALITDNALTIPEEKHNWLPAAADCSVTGKIKLYNNQRRRKSEFTGRGYHDHHWGNEPLFESYSDWCRGRVISNEYSLLYYYIRYPDKNRKEFKKLILFKDKKLITEINDFSLKTNSSKNYLLLNYDSKISIESGDIMLNVVNKRKVENGPFYMRFLSDFDLTIKNEKIISNKTGFSEFIKPKRFKSGFLKSFANKKILRIT